MKQWLKDNASLLTPMLVIVVIVLAIISQIALSGSRLDTQIDQSETRLDARIDRVEQRLDEKFERLEGKVDRIQGHS